MKSLVYYYTGTGNSLWTARTLAGELTGTGISPMTGNKNGSVPSDVDAVGLVFPVHMWGVPGLVLRFLESMEKKPDRYYFAFAVNAGQVSRTLVQLRNLMQSKGMVLSCGFDIVLPSNYIPWGSPPPLKRQEELFSAARNKIKQAAAIITSKNSGHIEKGPLWQRILFTALYKMTFGMVPKMDRDFWVDEKCNACSICARVCPVQNIVMQSDKPVWQHNCEQCLACIQWCPQEAIQFGRKTSAYERYHHPEVRIGDMIIRQPSKS
jgi:ferredoxin